jgi:hypothetical protein
MMGKWNRRTVVWSSQYLGGLSIGIASAEDSGGGGGGAFFWTLRHGEEENGHLPRDPPPLPSLDDVGDSSVRHNKKKLVVVLCCAMGRASPPAQRPPKRWCHSDESVRRSLHHSQYNNIIDESYWFARGFTAPGPCLTPTFVSPLYYKHAPFYFIVREHP